MEGTGVVTAVSASARHGFRKEGQTSIRLVAGMGIEGDAHAGTTTQHRYLMKKDPGRANLTQVHLLQEELFAELERSGFAVEPGDLGENITTRGVDLLSLPLGASLLLGTSAVVEVTGLRDPCAQLDRLHVGLMNTLRWKSSPGRVVRRAGIMGVVVFGGVVKPGATIQVALPSKPWLPMGPV